MSNNQHDPDRFAVGDRVAHPEFDAPGTISRFFVSNPEWCVVAWDDGARGAHPTGRLSRNAEEATR